MGAPPLRALFALTGNLGGVFESAGQGYRSQTGGAMTTWILNNAVGLVGGLGIVSILAIGLLVRASRNTRLLSRELDAADREIAERTSTVTELGTRLRIVRELHDGAVLSLARIVRQAEASGYLVDGDSAASLRSTKLIANLARDTLAELRRIVTVAGDGQIVEAVQPSIHSLAVLLNESRRAGLTIIFSETGESFEPKPGADAAIYRIVEEALSNALQFGGTDTEVRVSFTWTDEGL